MSELVLPSIRVRQKSGAIWGSDWLNFMGIEGSSSSGVQEYASGNKGDFNRAFFNPMVYRCIQVRGSAMVQAPLRVFAPTTHGRKPIDHEATEVLARTNPKGWYCGDQLLRATLASLDLHGHFAWQLAFGSDKVPTEIYFTPPGAYEPKASKQTGFLSGIKVRDKGEDQVIPVAQLVYDATMSLTNPIAGTSKISAARMDLNLQQYGMASNLWFLKNNMRPDWILTGDFAPTEENTARIRRLINQWAGGDNRRGPLVLGGGNMSAHLLTMERKDAEWVEQQQLSRSSIANIFGVPEPLVNMLANATLANVDAYKRSFFHDTMGPELKELGDSLTRNYLWRWPDAIRHGLCLDFDLAQVEGLGEDINKIWEREFEAAKIYIDSMLQRGLTPNQYRQLMVQVHERLGLDASPFEGKVRQGDDVLVNWNFIPAEQAGMTSVIDAMAARGPNAGLVQNIPPAGQVPADFESAADEMLQGQLEMERARAQAGAQAGGGAPSRTQGQKAPVGTEKAGANPVPIRDRRLEPIQQKLVRKLKKHFQNLQTQALRTLRGQKADQPDYWNQDEAMAEVREILAEAVALSGAAAYGAAAEDYGLAVAWDVNNPWLPDYMGVRAEKIKGIAQTTLDQLVTSLTEGGQAGESIPDLSKRVTDVFAEAIGSRADTIARTETIQAYAAASLQAYRDAGIDQVKVYDGTGDDECAQVNGDVVSVAEGDSLMGLEHPNGTRGVAPVVDLSQTMASAVSVRDGVASNLEIATGSTVVTPKAHSCDLPKIKSARRPQDFVCDCGKAWMYRPGGSGPSRWGER